MPTEYGDFRLHVYKSRFDKSRGIDLALTFGTDRFKEDDIPLVRVQSEWSIANIVNRLSNDEGSYLNQAMKAVADSGECRSCSIFEEYSRATYEFSFPSRKTTNRHLGRRWSIKNIES